MSDSAVKVRDLVEAYQVARRKSERREKGRIDLVQPVEVVTETGETLTLLTRDISEVGIRLIGTRRFLGQRVTVRFPAEIGGVQFAVRILWACPIGDDLVENGGTFLPALVPPSPLG